LPSRYFRVPLSEIAYVRMIVEAFDGLAVVRSLSSSRGEIEWIIGEGMEAEAEEVAQRLAQLTGMCPIERPADWHDLTRNSDASMASATKKGAEDAALRLPGRQCRLQEPGLLRSRSTQALMEADTTALDR